MKLIEVCLKYVFSDYRYLYKTFCENYNCTQNKYPNRYIQTSLNAKTISHVSYELFYNEDATLRTLKEFIKKF